MWGLRKHLLREFPIRVASLASVADSRIQARCSWSREALQMLTRMRNRETTTPLIKLSDMDGGPPIFSRSPLSVDLYLKDESAHRSGSLKHRLAMSLFTYKIISGQIREGMTVIEASSGSTAISEAYFASHLGLPFIAVVAASTSKSKLSLIEKYGGSYVKVNDPSAVYSEALAIEQRFNLQAAEGHGKGAHYMDQFTYAEAATEWRGFGNLGECIISQMKGERYSIPAWFVVGAGTGGTATALGRYLSFHNFVDSKVCVVDPETSVFYDAFVSGDRSLALPPGMSSRIEGIGRPRVEPSFRPEVVDHMIRVPDAASVAAMRFLHKLLGVDSSTPGPSTGTNLYGCIFLIDQARRAGNDEFSIVSLLCDNGRRYEATYYNDAWLASQNIQIDRYYQQISNFWSTGILEPVTNQIPL